MILNALLAVIGIGVFLIVILTGCSQIVEQPMSAGIGVHPALPLPQPTFIPTVNIAHAIGWPDNASPKAANGMRVDLYASGLDHPRWLYVLPDGDVLVAESNAPPKPEDGKGIKGWIMGLAMKRAGAAVASANRITLLRDTNNDGVADLRSTLLDKLNSPFGMALIGNDLYIADTDKVLLFPYHNGDTRITATAIEVLKLPAGEINHHWTKNIIANSDGSHLYVTVGSNSNAAERGMAVEEERAVILELDIKTGAHRIFASGLRNPNGLAWEAESGELWTAVNERDELGDDLVPDYITSVHDGDFFGWPYSYYGQHVDTRVQPQRPELVAKAIVPDYALGSHTGSLGLTWSAGTTLPLVNTDHGIGEHTAVTK